MTVWEWVLMENCGEVRSFWETIVRWNAWLTEASSLLGGDRAMREPWRNTLAQLLSSLGWDHFLENYGQLELAEFLKKQPVSTYQSMLQLQRNAPLASSAGRLFDAVAGAIGLCQESVSFEGQAAMQLQGLAERL